LVRLQHHDPWATPWDQHQCPDPTSSLARLANIRNGSHQYRGIGADIVSFFAECRRAANSVSCVDDPNDNSGVAHA
jgi:hypothetical protein